jgi:hypothetical protein
MRTRPPRPRPAVWRGAALLLSLAASSALIHEHEHQLRGALGPRQPQQPNASEPVRVALLGAHLGGNLGDEDETSPLLAEELATALVRKGRVRGSAAATTVTLSELASRHAYSDDGMSTIVRLAPFGSSPTMLVNDIANVSLFPGGNPCCLSHESSDTCERQVPCDDVTTVQDSVLENRRKGGPAWEILTFRCVDTSTTAKSVATSCKTPSHAASSRGEYATAVCVPTWYDDMSNPGVSAYFADWLAHYKDIGASRAYIYAEDPEPEWLAEAIARHGPSKVMDVVWVHVDLDFENQEKFEDLWYHGQVWALNDCPKRARADGFQWVLSQDVDEMLTFVDPALTITTYLEGLGSSVGDVDGVVFDTVLTAPTRRCGSDENYACASLPLPQAGNRLQPKHLTSTSRVHRLGIHCLPDKDSYHFHDQTPIGTEGEGGSAGCSAVGVASTKRRHCKIHHDKGLWFNLTHTAWFRHMKTHDDLVSGELCASCVVFRSNASSQQLQGRQQPRTCTDSSWAFVAFAKTGSTSFRHCERFHMQKECSGNITQTGLGGSGKFDGYFTILREPVARTASSYNYFCLDCSEDGRFCGTNSSSAPSSSAPRSSRHETVEERIRNREHREAYDRQINTGCPNMTIEAWTELWGNLYVHELSGANAAAAQQLGVAEHWLEDPPNSWSQIVGASGWALGLPEVVGPADAKRELARTPLEEQQRVAMARITDGTIHALPLEGLDEGGWGELDGFVGATPSGKTWAGCASEERSNTRAHSEPSQEEQSRLRKILWGDISLYEHSLEMLAEHHKHQSLTKKAAQELEQELKPAWPQSLRSGVTATPKNDPCITLPECLGGDQKFNATYPEGISSNSGGVLVWALGRSGTETFFQLIKAVSNNAIHAIAGDKLGGESFRKVPNGIPKGALRETIERGFRYAHLKPKHLHAENTSMLKTTRIQDVDELMASAKEAGFTVVVNVYRANELATLLSAVAMEENRLKRTNNSPDAGEDYSADEMCYPHSEWWNDSSLQTNFSSLPEKFERQREQIHSGLAAAVKAGLATMSVTFEDVVTRGCDVGKAVVDFYNKNSEQKLSQAGTCEEGLTGGHSSHDDAQTIEGQMGKDANTCLLDDFQKFPEYKWMLEESAKVLRAPPGWPKPTDGIQGIYQLDLSNTRGLHKDVASAS